jgi:hypothetical protein
MLDEKGRGGENASETCSPEEEKNNFKISAI